MTAPDEAAPMTAIQALIGRSDPPQPGPDPVNEPMIRHWCEALGDANPVYTDAEAARSVHGGIIAPPAMLQAWTLPGLPGHDATAGDPSQAVYRLLDDAGFSSVVATNCEQEYIRPLRPGDRLTSQVTVESVSGPKNTRLGTGHFVTTRLTVRDHDGEVVGTQLFRVLKFMPPAGTRATGTRAAETRAAGTRAVDPPEPRAVRPRPSVTRDTAFFFDAARDHRLAIQRCTSCGTLRHPPGPLCPACRSPGWDTVDARGPGEVFSFVVVHHPLVAPFTEPYVVAVVALKEGVRVVANLVDIAPADVQIGMPVQLGFIEPDPELTLPAFGPA
jgi:uncharacterized OB-fold protein/acyl dehydratase